VFDRDKAATLDVVVFVDSDYAGDLDKRRSYFWIYLHYVCRCYLVESITSVYCSSFYYRRSVYCCYRRCEGSYPVEGACY